MELRHAFNVCGCDENLPEEEVQGFRSAMDELARDFKQLATMLLAVNDDSFVQYTRKEHNEITAKVCNIGTYRNHDRHYDV